MEGRNIFSAMSIEKIKIRNRGDFKWEKGTGREGSIWQAMRAHMIIFYYITHGVPNMESYLANCFDCSTSIIHY